MSWLHLWTIVFFGAFGAFVVISALVAVRGYGEVRALFQAPVPPPADEGGPARRPGDEGD